MTPTTDNTRRRADIHLGKRPDLPVVSMGRRNTSLIEEVVMARGYRRLSLADEDEIWSRLRAGHAAKPTARALGM